MSLESQLDLSIVVPVYYSEALLQELTNRCFAVLDHIGMPGEIIFIDDDSRDNSWNILEELRNQYPDRIIAIRLMRNVGQHNAIMCGLRYARGRYIVTMDDDLQNPPEEIPKLIEAIRGSELDVVYGQIIKKRHSNGRNFGSWIVNVFFRIVFRCPIAVTSFRIMRRELAQSILSYELNFTYIDGLLAWNTTRFGQTPVAHHARKSNRTGYSLSKLVTLALNLFTNFSLLPLQIVSGVGLLTAVFGLIAGLYYLIQSIRERISVPGYASIIVAVLVLGGVQLLAIGIIGEYLGRLHLNVNRKPQYTIRTLHRSREPQLQVNERNQSLEG